MAIDVVAISLSRALARSLHGFAGVSTPWLLHQFVRRAGLVRLGESIQVVLDRRAVDNAFADSGFLDEVECVPRLGMGVTLETNWHESTADK